MRQLVSAGKWGDLKEQTRTAINETYGTVGTDNEDLTQHHIVDEDQARLGMIVFGVIMATGGIIGYLRSGSKVSIISGVLAGVIFAGAYLKHNLQLAFVTASIVTLIFAIRFFISKKFIPTGFLCILCLAATVFFALSMYG